MLFKTKLWVIDSALQDLGIEPSEEKWHDFTLILGQVAGYKHFYETGDEEGTVYTGKTIVYLPLGSITINVSYPKFDRVMEEFYKEKVITQ